MSAVWDRVRANRAARGNAASLSFDWFILALCFLNAISAVELVEGDLIAPARVAA
ncbi:ABC-three component system middle component 6 [Methylobacterium sp. WL64]|uniref:ABC-three component system middle component 6 n=1 Tax=Methylobacterium sp. WL64 TaxID=2603894 RepID=UPI001FEDDD97|nr:ABC-three component system middle component 6 [Methylobacterium sp. WL64]